MCERQEGKVAGKRKKLVLMCVLSHSLNTQRQVAEARIQQINPVEERQGMVENSFLGRSY